jgi:hypothetical protein
MAELRLAYVLCIFPLLLGLGYMDYIALLIACQEFRLIHLIIQPPMHRRGSVTVSSLSGPAFSSDLPEILHLAAKSSLCPLSAHRESGFSEASTS